MDFGGVARILAPLVGKPVLKGLARRTLASRVARRVVRSTRRRGWNLSRRSLARVLRDRSVLEELSRSDGGGYAHSLARLRFALPRGTSDEVAELLLEVVAVEYVAALPDRESAHLHVSREVGAARDEIRDVQSDIVELSSQLDATLGFDSAMERFHPWRRREAVDIRHGWRSIDGLVHQLADPERRASVLADWSSAPPTWSESAPASAFGWLGLLATEASCDPQVAAYFFGEALDRGISPRAIWRVRLFQQLDLTTAESATWFDPNENHPLIRAIELEANGDREGARDQVLRWHPTERPELAQRAAILAQTALVQGDFAAAVQLATEAYQEWSATGAGLVAIDALFALSGTRRDSAERASDVRTAVSLATRVRDDRRRWGIDAVPAVLAICRGKHLLDDLDGALRTCLPDPLGDATPAEAASAVLAGEAIRIAARMGVDLPDTYSSGHLDEEVSAARIAAAGYAAARAGDESTAASKWAEAFDLETDPLERLELATQLAFIGVEVDTSDLRSLDPETDATEELRLIARLFRDGDAPTIALVRTRALTRRSFAAALYDFHSRSSEHNLAAELMVRSARQWGEPSMWLRAAKAYADYPNHDGAVSAARQVLESNVSSVDEQRRALIIIAEASSALGRWPDARTATARLVEIDPSSDDYRWAHIRVLFQTGDLESALDVYRANEPRPAPRSGDEILLLAQLHRVFGDRAIDAPSLVFASDPWREEEQVRGRVLLCVLMAPHEQESSDDESDEAPSEGTLRVREAMADFTRTFPTSSLMYTVEFDPSDPLASLREALGNSPDTSELDALVVEGRAPLGFAASIHSRTYLEVILRRPTPARFFDDRALREASVAALLESMSGTTVVLDTTVAFTFALLGAPTQAELLGAIPNVVTHTALVNDAREASLTLERESGMTVAPSASEGPMIRITPDDELVRLRTQARAAFAGLRLLAATGDSAEPPEHYSLPEFGGERPAWLAAVDYTRASGAILWSDDRVLRDLARQLNVRSFSTSDLVIRLSGQGGLAPDVADLVRAILVANGFVGQPISVEDFVRAADLVQWRDDALAASLQFGDFLSVQDRLACFELALDHAADNPLLLGRLSYCFATWVLNTPVDAAMRDGLIAATITGVLAKPWLDAGKLPFILDGVRSAYEIDGGSFAALEGAVRSHFRLLARVADPATAAIHIRGLFALTRPEERYVVTQVTLTTQ